MGLEGTASHEAVGYRREKSCCCLRRSGRRAGGWGEGQEGTWRVSASLKCSSLWILLGHPPSQLQWHCELATVADGPLWLKRKIHRGARGEAGRAGGDLTLCVVSPRLTVSRSRRVVVGRTSCSRQAL